MPAASPTCGGHILLVFVRQVLGDTLDKIAWEKGGIFKEGCKAFTVEQPRGGMSVLRQASTFFFLQLFFCLRDLWKGSDFGVNVKPGRPVSCRSRFIYVRIHSFGVGTVRLSGR